MQAAHSPSSTQEVGLQHLGSGFSASLGRISPRPPSPRPTGTTLAVQHCHPAGAAGLAQTCREEVVLSDTGE